MNNEDNLQLLQSTSSKSLQSTEIKMKIWRELADRQLKLETSRVSLAENQPEEPLLQVAVSQLR